MDTYSTNVEIEKAKEMKKAKKRLIKKVLILNIKSRELPYLENYVQLTSLDIRSIRLEDINIIDKMPISLIYLKLYIHCIDQLPDMSKYINIIDLQLMSSTITSFGNLPPNLKIFECSDCILLNSLGNIPHCLEVLDCSSCKSLPNLDNLISTNLKKLKCDWCIFTSLDMLPPCLLELICRWCKLLTNLDNLPPFVEQLTCIGCINITNLDNIPNVKVLNCKGCTLLTSLDNLSPNLEELDCSSTSITNLDNVPTLKKLKCSDCDKLTSLNNLSPILEALECSWCPNISSIDNFPLNLNTVAITHICDLPIYKYFADCMRKNQYKHFNIGYNFI